MNYGILFDVSDFWHLPDMLNNGASEMTSVTHEMTIMVLVETNGTFSEDGVLLMSSLEEAKVVV